jgi:hypothetical protein
MLLTKIGFLHQLLVLMNFFTARREDGYINNYTIKIKNHMEYLNLKIFLIRLFIN